MRVVAGLALALVASVAAAHPLGNFTTNRQARLTVAPDRLVLRYVVDAAEVPTFRLLAEIDVNGDGVPDAGERAAWATTLAAAVARDVRVLVDARALALRPTAREATTQPGAGGLPTLRAEIVLEAPLAVTRGTLVVRDDGFAGLPGWQDILVEAAPGTTLARSTAAAYDRTNGLRTYPDDLLAIPPQVREARAAFEPGGSGAITGGSKALRADAERFGDRLTALVADPTPLSAGVALSALLVAAMLGALHALTPGHGKTIVGAYLVGTRGTWRHAVFLGLVVTATHTAGVYALGAATLAASAWILPERVLPWLSIASGLLVLGVGATLAGTRLGEALHAHGHDHHHDHAPPVEVPPTLGNLIALGVSGGLLPCPSALVVMLGAIALGRTAFGLALVLAFSVGLAAVLTAIGVVLVNARQLFDRLPIGGRLARFAPVASAAVISLAGLAIALDALRRIAA